MRVPRRATAAARAGASGSGARRVRAWCSRPLSSTARAPGWCCPWLPHPAPPSPAQCTCACGTIVGSESLGRFLWDLANHHDHPPVRFLRPTTAPTLLHNRSTLSQHARHVRTPFLGSVARCVWIQLPLVRLPLASSSFFLLEPPASGLSLLLPEVKESLAFNTSVDDVNRCHQLRSRLGSEIPFSCQLASQASVRARSMSSLTKKTRCAHCSHGRSNRPSSDPATGRTCSLPNAHVFLAPLRSTRVIELLSSTTRAS